MCLFEGDRGKQSKRSSTRLGLTIYECHVAASVAHAGHSSGTGIVWPGNKPRLINVFAPLTLTLRGFHWEATAWDPPVSNNIMVALDWIRKHCSLCGLPLDFPLQAAFKNSRKRSNPRATRRPSPSRRLRTRRHDKASGNNRRRFAPLVGLMCKTCFEHRYVRVGYQRQRTPASGATTSLSSEQCTGRGSHMPRFHVGRSVVAVAAGSSWELASANMSITMARWLAGWTTPVQAQVHPQWSLCLSEESANAKRMCFAALSLLHSREDRACHVTLASAAASLREKARQAKWVRSPVPRPAQQRRHAGDFHRIVDLHHRVRVQAPLPRQTRRLRQHDPLLFQHDQRARQPICSQGTTSSWLRN